MSFTNAPVTRALVVGLVTTSVAVSLLDIKHYFYILVDTHIWRYHQAWRVLLYQLCYTNSSEVLFASMVLYKMRVIERMWGSRKYASFIAVTALLTAILPPALLTLVLGPLTGGLFNYLPAGPTPIIFAVLAQYHAIIPHAYKYRLALSASSPGAAATAAAAYDDNAAAAALTFSDKSYGYALAAQLALLQWPGSLLGAAVGWVVGRAWRQDLLPGPVARWRVPGWIVGVRSPKRRNEFEGLRRRLESETSGSATGVLGAAAGTGAGADADAGADAGRRRTMGQQIMDQFRGAL